MGYKKLEDLGLSMLVAADGGTTNVSRKLQYLDILLGELTKRRIGNQQEEMLHEMDRRFLNSISESGTATDKQLAEAFIAQLTGPLSRKVILAKYSTQNPQEPMNWKQLADDIRGGKLDDLLIYPKLNPYMKMFLNRTMAPKKK